MATGGVEIIKVATREINCDLNNGLTDIPSLGTANEDTTNANMDLTSEVTDVLKSDRHIWWFDVLPNEQVIVLGYDEISFTSQLTLYNSANKKFLSQLDLPYAVSADILDDHQVIVPLPETQQLQIFSVDNDILNKDAMINTNVDIWLILKYTDNSVLALAEQSDDDEFQILDLTGQVEQRVKLNTDLPFPVSMKMNHERNVVYIVDQNKGCIGFNLKGGVIFHYTHENYDGYAGLAVDPIGDFYFSAGVSEETEIALKSMIKLSPAGQVLKQLDVRNTVPLLCIGDMLYVVNDNGQIHYIHV